MINPNKISLLLCLSVCVRACGGFGDVGVCLSMCICAGVPGCRSPTPFSRATLRQRCGGSSVWAMPSCSVPLSSSWGACFSWPLRCFSWMTGRRQRNSKWLRHCLNNSSLFHLLFSHSFFKYLILGLRCPPLTFWVRGPNIRTHHLSARGWRSSNNIDFILSVGQTQRG